MISTCQCYLPKADLLLAPCLLKPAPRQEAIPSMFGVLHPSIESWFSDLDGCFSSASRPGHVKSGNSQVLQNQGGCT